MNVKNLFRSRPGSLDEERGAGGEDWTGEAPPAEAAPEEGQELNRALADIEGHLSTTVAEPVGDDGFVDLKAKVHARLVDQLDPAMLHRITTAQIEEYVQELIPIVLEDELTRQPDLYYVLAWNFKDEILRRHQPLIAQGVQFYFPVNPKEI